MFEEKIFKGRFNVFYEKPWFSIDSHLATVRTHQNLSDLAENFF
jgi:hypothetical protein